MLEASAPHGYRFESLSMSGWYTRRHLTLVELAKAIVGAEMDHTVQEWRFEPDSPRINFEEEYESTI